MTLPDPDPRLLRAFLAVAEELHFTRAAARLYVAQQALSRDVARLERELGTPLFQRTTRQVRLTPDGERLVPHARRVLDAQRALSEAFGAWRPLLVDVPAPVSTGRRVLDAAFDRAPAVDFVARSHGGLTGAAAALHAGRLDAAFGWFGGLPAALRDGLEHRLVRHERLAVLLDAAHPLAALTEVPLDALAGQTLYAGAGNPDGAEWTALARALFAGRDIHVAGDFPRIEGEEEFVRLVRRRGWSVLASEVFTEVPGMVLRPLVEPVPLSPVALVWRRGLRHPGLDALLRAAGDLAGPPPPPGAWLPPGGLA